MPARAREFNPCICCRSMSQGCLSTARGGTGMSMASSVLLLLQTLLYMLLLSAMVVSKVPVGVRDQLTCTAWPGTEQPWGCLRRVSVEWSQPGRTATRIKCSERELLSELSCKGGPLNLFAFLGENAEDTPCLHKEAPMPDGDDGETPKLTRGPGSTRRMG